MPLSYRVHPRATYYWKNYDITPGLETRSGAEWGFLGGYAIVGGTHYDSPGDKFDQTTNHARLGFPGINIKYEYDWSLVFSIWWCIVVINFNFMKIMKLLILIFPLVILNNCKDMVGQDDEISIPKRPYLGNDLRLDGYYYAQIEDYIQVYFFYRDGTLLNCGYFPAHQLPQKKQMFQSEIFNITIQKYKYRWGLFLIDGQHIEFENWYASEPPLNVFGKEGEIINDSTFIVNEFYKVEDGIKILIEEPNEVYHFKQFSPKPDSTNSFVN